jgi:hypothetical protein
MNLKTAVLFLCAVALFSCNTNTNPPSTSAEAEKIILRFEVDTNGQITDAKVREQILQIGKDLHESGNKMMMTVYTEQTGSKEKNEETGWTLGWAARALMKTQGERSAYNMGIEVKGFENPIDSANPANRVNRRIEIASIK